MYINVFSKTELEENVLILKTPLVLGCKDQRVKIPMHVSMT